MRATTNGNEYGLSHFRFVVRPIPLKSNRGEGNFSDPPRQNWDFVTLQTKMGIFLTPRTKNRIFYPPQTYFILVTPQAVTVKSNSLLKLKQYMYTHDYKK